MKLKRWMTRPRKSTNRLRAGTAGMIQSRKSFRVSITRERQRVDRNQHLLSLLLFTIGEQNSNGATAQQLVQLLAERIRLTDEVGWFDSKHIGVILPYTDAEGAYKLADEICKSFNPKTSVPEYAVYTYPSNWSSDANRAPVKSAIIDSLRKQEGTTSQSSYLSARHSQDGNSTSVVRAFTHDLTGSRGSLPQDVGPFFHQPLPVWKRTMDILGSLSGLLVLSPILVLVALIIKALYGGPVIFKQQRVGYSGRIFELWKFRTMKLGEKSSLHQRYMSSIINGAKGENSSKAMAKIDRDLPVTGLGRILRATSLDELPQLINVLFGEMTLIGPRPPTVYEVEDYLPWYCERFGIVPGMTGLWQVSGKNKLTFLEMIRLDIRYIRQLSVWSDVVISLKTPLVIAHDILDAVNSRKTESKLKGI
jgi:lipopolysaccharide/colanic/teichoic acid biosynthesis glycosyltransferase/chorismate mutase